MSLIPYYVAIKLVLNFRICNHVLFQWKKYLISDEFEKDNGIATYKKVCEQSKWKYPHMYRYLLCLPTKCKLQTVACSSSCIV